MTLIGTKRCLVKRIRISDRKFRLIIRCFVFDCTAFQASNLVLVNHNTADRYFNYLRSIVIKEAVKERKEEKIGNGIEIDESYFGPRRQRGKTGRGASKKIIVLGLRKRNGEVTVSPVPNRKKRTLFPLTNKHPKTGYIIIGVYPRNIFSYT